MKKLKLPTTSFGKQIELNGLSVFPLYLKSGLTTRVKSGLVMIDKKLVNVKEVSDAGSVPTLYVRNDSDHHVLFVEGDQLVGAKQNRICNSSVLMAPQSFAEIPPYPVWNRVDGRRNQQHLHPRAMLLPQRCEKF